MQIENDKIYNMDCLEGMKFIPDKSIDCIICDLPYGTTACSWDSVIPFDELWKHYDRIIKDEGIVVLFGSQPFTTKLICSNINNFRYELIWEKNNCSNFQLSNVQPLKYHENILIFYKDIIQTCFSDIIKYNMERIGAKQKDLQDLCPSKNGNPTGWLSNKLKGKQIPTKEQWHKICDFFNIKDEYDSILQQLKKHTYNVGNLKNKSKIVSNKGKSGTLGHLSSKSDTYIQEYENYPHSILKFDRVFNPLHPTQKPVELIEWLVKTYSNEGDVVLDNCIGSGTTAIACMNTNRHFIGFELDAKYFDIAINRINKLKHDNNSNK